jgi:hypothetical protein
MASPTTDGSNGLTARDVLCPDPTGLATVVAAALGEGEVAEALASAASGSALPLVVDHAARALDEILGNLQVDQLLMSAWEQLEEVRDLIEETRRGETTRNLTLVSHTIASEHEPSLQLVVNQAPRKLLDVLIALGFTIDACRLVIDGGEVTGVQLGRLRASGGVAANGRTILERETTELDPTRLFGALRMVTPPG